MPPDLRDRLLAARAAADLHPSTLDQAVLADFMVDGHFERHLRRMRSVYRERLDALIDAAERHCGGALRLRPVQTGLHAVADLAGVDAERAAGRRRARGRGDAALGLLPGTARGANGLVLGFGVVRPDASSAAWSASRWRSRRLGGADVALARRCCLAYPSRTVGADSGARAAWRCRMR